MKHYSPNHPSMRDQQPSVAERREAVRQRVGSHNNTKGLGIMFGVSLFLSAGLVEKQPAWSWVFLFLAVSVMPTLLRRINK